MVIVNAIFVFLFGLAFGSFMNVLIYRIPRGLNIAVPGSMCPKCSHKLKLLENIPVLSYIVLRGKCSFCGAWISPRYILAELLTSALFVFLYIKFGFSVLFFKYAVFVFIALAGSFTDIDTALDKDKVRFETGVIPDVYTYLGIFVALCFSIYGGNFTDSLAGCAAGYLVLLFPALIYVKIRKIEGIGEGDFGFLAMIGAFTGLASIPAVLFIASFVGIIVGALIVVFTKNGKYAIPFAPMLAVGGILYVFFYDMLNIYHF